MNCWKDHRYCLQNFREEVVRSLAELEEYGIPKLDQRKPPSIEPSVYETVHLPTFSIEKRNCKVCYKDAKRELKVKSYCSAPQCSVYLHWTNDKNCFAIWHRKDYHCWLHVSLIVWLFIESILPTDILSVCSPSPFVFIWETTANQYSWQGIMPIYIVIMTGKKICIYMCIFILAAIMVLFVRL